MDHDRRRNRLARFRFTGALWGWSYVFERPSPPVTFQSIGLEIGVALAGERAAESPRGKARFGRGSLCIFELGEQYATRYEPHGGQGREVGFLVRADRIEGWTSPERVLRFPRRDGLVDARIVELAESVAIAIDRGDPMGAKEIEAEVRRFVETHGELVPIDALARARLELVRHFDKPLYMRHFAEIAGVHEETFARKFAARYGLTPTRYRSLVRLKEAALLLATRPDLPVRAVAEKVGIDDPAYFHRVFAAQFGTTPLSLARAFSDSLAA